MQLTLRDIHKSFGEKQVLKGLSFTAEGGKAFGLLGRNGAGKTTTIRILMQVFPADKGEVLIDGKPMASCKVGTGYLPEERGLYPKKKIIDQLVYLASLKGMSYRAATKAVDWWLERLGMSETRNKRLDTLSKGNQQKIQLITALAHDPDIVVLDEPFSGLDPVNAMLLKDVVKEQIEKGKIVLFSSHQMNYVEEFCDSIAILHHGEIVLSGSIRALRRSRGRNRWLIQAGELEKAAGFCRERLWELVENVTLGKEGVTVDLRREEEAGALLSAIGQSGLAVDGVQLVTPTLNDIFVEATTADEAEGSEGK